MKNLKLRKLVEIAIFAALSLILDLLVPSLGWAFEPSFKMLPIIILSLRWGTGAGMTGGLLWGLLQIAVGEATILGAIQLILEYLLAFAVVGLAGLFHKPVQRALRAENVSLPKAGLFASLATVTASLIRYTLHFIAGFIFWGQYAPEGQSPVLYSFLTNGSAFLTETITCLVVLWLMVPAFKSIVLNKDLAVN